MNLISVLRIDISGLFVDVTKNASIQVLFMQSNGSTAATTTAGAGTISVHYNFV